MPRRHGVIASGSMHRMFEMRCLCLRGTNAIASGATRRSIRRALRLPAGDKFRALIYSSLTGTVSTLRHYHRVSPDAIGSVPFRDYTQAVTADETSKVCLGITTVRRAPLLREQGRRRFADGVDGGILKNKYTNDPSKRAAWISASHVEKAPKKKDPPTP